MPIPPGVYRIKNAETGSIFTLSKSEGFGIQGWRQNGQANQHWFVQYMGDGVVFKNVESGQYAYVPTGSLANHLKLFGSGTPTVWALLPNGNAWSIYVHGSKFIIELGGCNRADGGGINLWEDCGYKYQRWVFEKIDDRQPQQLPEGWFFRADRLSQEYFQQTYQQPQSVSVSPGTYFLRNVMSGTLITLCGGSTDEGAEISGYSYNGGSHQKWQLQPTRHGQNMTFLNVQTNNYLWFQGQSFVPSFSVKSSRTSQEYVITAANRGFYISPAQQPGYVLSLLRGSGQNGTEISIWHNDQQDNQKWHFDHV
ncbi:unnamed protein product [Rhizoctonia solani]|uniref:Ricin B lectin domain-containing protein n=1 Tax=Rhizoctonia solani TaxID=456999 RepID=A0A8H3D667_9AGAM|nr:unnamed protein product [Rhizoctonia solani]